MLIRHTCTNVIMCNEIPGLSRCMASDAACAIVFTLTRLSLKTAFLEQSVRQIIILPLWLYYPAN